MRAGSDELDTTVLVDMRVLAGLGRVLGTVQAQCLAWDAVQMYSRYCDGMEPQGGQPAQPAQAIANAHKLKGSAGTLGLPAIAEVAGRVEAALESGSDGGDVILELRLTIEATRQDMLALGMVPPAVNS